MSARIISPQTRRLPRRPPMRRLLQLVSAVTVICCLGACAQPWQRVAAGDNTATVATRLGKAKEIYPTDDGGQRWLWPTQPFGETTTAAEFDAKGQLVSVEQVLTNTSFARAVAGKWTQEDVQSHFGIPEEKSYFPLMKRAVWSYRYMDDGVWYMLYHFYFDDSGVLQKTQKTPDPLHDPEHRLGMF